MRIAVDTRELQGQPTGVGRLLAEILTAWQTLPEAQGHDIIQLTPDGPDRGTLWEQFDLPGRVRRSQADVLFSPGYTGPLRPPVPMVVAIHDVSFAAHPEWFSWREGARRRTITRLAARAATRVITISEFSKREIVGYLGIDESKISVVYPGVSSSDVERPFTERPTILFVGSIFNRRHVPELIAGFARLARTHPEIRLEIVGDNRTSPHIGLMSRNGVNVRSYVPDEELRQLYAGSAAFAFLSEYEGFGLTPLEALAAGLPVLLLDTPVAREICGEAALYVKRADPALIEQALESLLFNTAERERILSAASTLLRRYSWTECARHVLHVLVEAAGG